MSNNNPNVISMRDLLDALKYVKQLKNEGVALQVPTFGVPVNENIVNHTQTEAGNKVNDQDDFAFPTPMSQTSQPDRQVTKHDVPLHRSATLNRIVTLEQASQDVQDGALIQSNPTPTDPLVGTIFMTYDLGSLGKPECIEETSPVHDVLRRYIENSHGVESSIGVVRIHGIYHIHPGASSSSSHVPSQTPRMLLWFKTTRTSIRHLAMKRSGCIAFYDRVARAFATIPEEVEDSMRQLLLLCAVPLGNMLKSKEGYQYWSKQPPMLVRHDSVQAVGRYIPDWEENEEIVPFVTVPCGQTLENPEEAHFKFNEYYIFEATRVRVMYAADVEIDRRVCTLSAESTC